MAGDRWTEVNRLFHEAVGLVGDARAAFLGRACGGDEPLRREVESLLRHHDRPAPFLEESAVAHAGIVDAAASLERSEADHLVGRAFGPYRIDRRIASGGMGTVYHATRDDEFLSQEVAIKVLHRAMDNEDLRRRFRIEREAQATLDHPSIARLQDAGVTHDGIPYMVMEYIDGVPIDEYCDDRRLSVVERLRLFQRVCGAVHFAHQNLVVHRDLKPSNILVTPAGVPKLVDFGVAKMLDHDESQTAAHRTETMRQMLSIGYASPEQVSGERVTTESDIYSLGVILYELMAGGSPYRLTSHRFEEIERAICVTIPRRPSTAVRSMTARLPRDADGAPREPAAKEIADRRGTTAERLARALRGDLDSITMTAMRKEPARRYASAQQFSEDIQRYLDGHPIVARPDTLLYRVTKFVRRNQVGVGAALVVATALVGATIVTARQATIVSAERDAARLAELAAGHEAAHARIEADSAQQVADFLVEAFLIGVPSRSEAEPEMARQLLDRQTTRVRLQYRDEPHVRANLLDAVGNVHRRLHLHARAEELILEAMEIRRAEFGSESLETALSLNSLGELDYARGRYAEAADSFREALRLHESLPEGVHTDIALACNNLAVALRMLREVDRSEGLHIRALALRRSRFGDESPLVAESLNNLAGISMIRGDFELALSRLRDALAIRRATLGDAHPLVAQTLSNLATAHVQAGELDAAEAPLREAIDLYRAMPGVAEEELARALRPLAEILRARGELDEAERLLNESLASLLGIHGPDHPSLAYTYESLAILDERRGDLESAEGRWREAMRIRAAVLPADHPLRLSVAAGCGRVVLNAGRADEALAMLRDVLEGFRRIDPPDLERTVAVQLDIARCLERLDRLDEAAAIIEEVLAVAPERVGAHARQLLEERRRHRADDETAR